MQYNLSSFVSCCIFREEDLRANHLPGVSNSGDNFCNCLLSQVFRLNFQSLAATLRKVVSFPLLPPLPQRILVST